MQYTQQDVGKRAVHTARASEKTRYGYIRGVLDLPAQEQADGSMLPRQYVDFNADGATRKHDYVWHSEVQLLSEDHPEYTPHE